MDTRKITKEYRLSHWAQIIHDRAESGLSIRAYCENAGFHENVYYYWQRKLREAACEQLSAPNQSGSLVASGFTEVSLSETHIQPSLDAPPISGSLQIEVSGIQINADSSYPPEQLAQLLSALNRQC